MMKQTNLQGEVVKFWEHRPTIEFPGLDVDDFPVLDIDLAELAETPIWECFKSNPPKTVDGYILVGNCGVPGYTREACWAPVLDDLCSSCSYHLSNDPEREDPWEDPEEDWL